MLRRNGTPSQSLNSLRNPRIAQSCAEIATWRVQNYSFGRPTWHRIEADNVHKLHDLAKLLI
jgi:hypothetical protein